MERAPRVATAHPGLKLRLRGQSTLCRLASMGTRKMSEPRMTLQTLRALNAFVAGSEHELSGADILRTSGLFSGTLYPILMRLEDAGWLRSRWEEIDPSDVGRPRRRFYRLTGVGRRAYEAEQQLIGSGART